MYKELTPVIKPVVDKVSSIINTHIKNHDVSEVYLVGGTCCFNNIEEMIENYIKIPTIKPKNPLFVTPLGIALNCTQEIME